MGSMSTVRPMVATTIMLLLRIPVTGTIRPTIIATR